MPPFFGLPVFAPGAITLFLRQWGAPILAALLALGLGLGFWLFVSGTVDARREAEANLVAVNERLLDERAQSLVNAERLGYYAGRLDAEAKLSQSRISGEASREAAAAARLTTLAGNLNELRTTLETRPCGIGPDIDRLLRDGRADREAERIARSSTD